MQAGYKVVLLDNFENSDRSMAARLPSIVQGGDITLIEGDVRSQKVVEEVLRTCRVNAVVHLAGKKAVGQSVDDPLLYFHDNLLGAIALMRGMREGNVPILVFSSSATVYGIPSALPIDEAAPTGATNPYGRTKLMIEQMIDDVAASWDEFRAISLRYFNPVGAHQSALIGEHPRGIPTNLFPYVAQTAAGLRDKVRVLGCNFDTPDGTGIRDFIHVVDLAKGHVRAMDLLFQISASRPLRHQRINLGTGRGYSVLQVLDEFSRACGQQIPYEIVTRRPGDVAASVADPSLAADLLGWRAECDLSAMCRDHWAFQLKNGHIATPTNDSKAPAASCGVLT
jgi:UDP-glucose 4-epimerase